VLRDAAVGYQLSAIGYRLSVSGWQSAIGVSIINGFFWPIADGR
jgi:hypothetical protein